MSNKKTNEKSTLMLLLQNKAKYDNIDDCPQKVALIEKCVELADKLENIYEKCETRWDLIWAYQFGGDPVKALPYCAEFLEMINYNNRFSNSLKQELKITIIGLMYNLSSSVPYISKKQCKSLLDEMENLVNQSSTGKGSLASHKCSYFCDEQNMEELEKWLKIFKETPRDRLSDCEVCEISDIAEYNLFLGKKDEAFDILNSVLENNKTCAEEPWSTITTFLKYCLEHNELEQAKKFGTKLFQRDIDNIDTLPFAAALMHLEIATKNNRYADVPLFERCINMSSEIFDKIIQFKFYLGAWCFSKYLATKSKEIKLNLLSSFPLYSKDNTYDLEKLQNHFFKQAENIALAFDKRNESNFFYKDIEQTQKIINLYLNEV